MIVNYNNSFGLSDYLAFLGFIIFVVHYVFSAHSLSNSSNLLSVKLNRNKFFSVMVLVCFFLGFLLTYFFNWFNELPFIKNLKSENLLVNQLPIFSVFLVMLIVSLIFYFKDKDITEIIENKAKIEIYTFINLLISPIVIGMIIGYFVKLAIMYEINLYNNIAILLIDFFACILFIGFIHFSLNHNKEIAKITLRCENEGDEKTRTVNGIIIAEDDTFINVILVNEKLQKINGNRPVSYNKSIVVESNEIESVHVGSKKNVDNKNRFAKFIFNRIIFRLLLIQGISRISELEREYAENLIQGLAHEHRTNKEKVLKAIKILDDTKYRTFVKLISKKQYLDAKKLLKLDIRD